MHKLSLLVVFAVGFLAVGCGGVVEPQPGAPDAVSTEAISSSDEGQVQSAVMAGDVSGGGDCNGYCDGEVCVCSGGLCCEIFCEYCFSYNDPY